MCISGTGLTKCLTQNYNSLHNTVSTHSLLGFPIPSSQSSWEEAGKWRNHRAVGGGPAGAGGGEGVARGGLHMLRPAQALHHRHPLWHWLLHLLWHPMQLGRGHRQHGQQPHHLQRQQGGRSGEWSWKQWSKFLVPLPFTEVKPSTTARQNKYCLATLFMYEISVGWTHVTVRQRQQCTLREFAKDPFLFQSKTVRKFLSKFTVCQLY